MKSHHEKQSPEIEQCLNETYLHIASVASKINKISAMLYDRGVNHDLSKTQPPELDIFAEYTPKLKGTTYGSDIYNDYLKEMGVALRHHYKASSHHPEHFTDGVQDMNLVDIVEMFCDWLAATERHDDGDILRSITINQDRFDMSDDLAQIFRNTVKLFK